MSGDRPPEPLEGLSAAMLGVRTVCDGEVEAEAEELSLLRAESGAGRRAGRGPLLRCFIVKWHSSMRFSQLAQLGRRRSHWAGYSAQTHGANRAASLTLILRVRQWSQACVKRCCSGRLRRIPLRRCTSSRRVIAGS